MFLLRRSRCFLQLKPATAELWPILLAILWSFFFFNYALPNEARAEEKQAKRVVLKVGTVAPEKTAWASFLKTIDEKLQADSAGKIALDIGYGGAYGAELEALELCKKGKLEIAAVSTTIVAAFVPELNALEMPYLFESSDEAHYIIDKIVTPVVEKKLEKQGFKILLWGDNGFKNIATSKKPVRNLKDMNGLKIRTQQSKIYQAFFEALGAKPVKFNVREVARALQVGLIEGFDNTPLFVYSSRLHLHVKYYTMTRHTFQPVLILLSKKRYDAFTDDVKQGLTINSEALANKGRDIVNRAQPVALKAIKAKGVKVIRLEPRQRKKFTRAAKSLYENDGKKILTPSGASLMKKIRKALKAFREK